MIDLTHLVHALPLLGLAGFQIGPKIRIGGTLGKLGQDLKIGVGKLEKAAAPVVAMIPGIGQIAAPILNTSGSIFDTSGGGIHTLGDVGKIALTDALEALPGATGMTTKLAGGATGLNALPAELKNLAGGANSWLTKIPGVGGIESMLTGGGTAGAGGTGSSSGGLGGLVQSLSGIFGGGSGGPGGGSGMDKALLLASIAQQADQRQRQQDLQNKGLSYATDAYNAMAPIRSQGMSYLTNNNIPDLSSIFGDPANPFARKVPTPTIGKAVPVINPVAA